MLRRLIVFAATGAFVCLAAAVPVQADGITQINVPNGWYTSHTTLIDISGLTDGTDYTSIAGGGLTVDLINRMKRLTIPTSWAGWGSPPATEKSTAACPGLGINCPPVLWSKGANDVIMILSSPEKIFGFEAQPNNPQVESMTADFFDAGGNLVGSITLTPSGYFGAKLFAASSNTPFKSVILTDNGPGGTCPNGAVCDFAIANVRFSPNPVPEPASVLLLGTSLAALGFRKLRWTKT
jgi:hypothetical protein